MYRYSDEEPCMTQAREDALTLEAARAHLMHYPHITEGSYFSRSQKDLAAALRMIDLLEKKLERLDAAINVLLDGDDDGGAS